MARDIDEARRAGVVSTPTFLVGVVGADGSVRISRRIRGAQPLQVFRDTLNALVNANTGGSRETSS